MSRFPNPASDVRLQRRAAQRQLDGLTGPTIDFSFFLVFILLIEAGSQPPRLMPDLL